MMMGGRWSRAWYLSSGTDEPKGGKAQEGDNMGLPERDYSHEIMLPENPRHFEDPKAPQNQLVHA